MSSVTTGDLWREFSSSRMGMAGVTILAALVLTSILAMVFIPLETFQQWTNPNSWLSYPKTAVPVWVNLFLAEDIPEHMILESPAGSSELSGGISIYSESFTIDYQYNDFPGGFIYDYTAQYTGAPLLEVTMVRPDGLNLGVLSLLLPPVESETVHSGRIFSTDAAIRKNLELDSDVFGFDLGDAPSEAVIFADAQSGATLRGEYTFVVNMYGTDPEGTITDSTLVVDGKAFGIMGTDELRRDLVVGLLWGTPLALFIGLAVAVGSVVTGLVYGVYAGYRGRLTDESMMRFNDIVYALPALPFLIILAVTISHSIFLMVGFLMIFGWVGIAKVSRSMALQIKTRGYVEAAQMMGQRQSVIVFRHIIPQLLPYAFASIAISVPAAITTEAGLSFLGLGDPSFPTWGHILYDAKTYGAMAQGMWWWIVPPGMMIALTGLAFVFIGNALDAIVNPRLRR